MITKWKQRNKNIKKMHWKIEGVTYFPSTKSIELIFYLKDEYRSDTSINIFPYAIPVIDFKCLIDKTEEEITKVTLLGEEAIQWEKLDIHVGLEKLLMSIQLLEEWENSIT